MIAAALAACGFALAGCTQAQPPSGVLGAEDLGAGEWAGPYDDLSDATPERRLQFCTSDIGLWVYPDASAQNQASSIWASDDVVVWSLTTRLPGAEDAANKMASARLMEDCVAQAEGREPASFTFADDGTTILTEDRNEDDGTLWATDMAFTTAHDTTFVAVLVSYPADTEPTVTAADLLSRAVEAAADLPEDE